MPACFKDFRNIPLVHNVVEAVIFPSPASSQRAVGWGRDSEYWQTTKLILATQMCHTLAPASIWEPASCWMRAGWRESWQPKIAYGSNLPWWNISSALLCSIESFIIRSTFTSEVIQQIIQPCLNQYCRPDPLRRYWEGGVWSCQSNPDHGKISGCNWTKFLVLACKFF